MYRVLITNNGHDDEYKTTYGICKALERYDVECVCSLDLADLETCDGVIAPGYPPDVDPALYGEEKEPGCGTTDRAMDEARLAIIDAAIKAGKPILGLCAGYQLLNVYFGGTLVQDLGRRAMHASFDGMDWPLHHVYTLKNTPFHMFYPEEGIINAAHHQAVKKVAPCFDVMQVWVTKNIPLEERKAIIKKIEDGEIDTFDNHDYCVEAFHHKTLPIFGLQWHPEGLVNDPTPGTLDPYKPFEYFAYLVNKTALENK